MNKLREKLVELVDSVLRNLPWGEVSLHTAEDVADRLIEHGVTVQEWISVKDRLPEYGRYLCNVKSMAFRGASYQAILKYENGGFIEDGIYTDFVTHWMPLPEPPKEN